MGKAKTITCDGCGEDITYRSNSVDYALCLSIYSPEPWYVKEGLEGGVMTCMGIYPAIKRDAYFCNSLDCLRAWLAGKEAVEKRAAERIEREKKFSERYGAKS